MFDWVLSMIERGGYLGLFALMVLENIFPPIPSELIMPLAGFHCAEGRMEPGWALAAGTAGSVAGALPWYYAGRLAGRGGLERLVDRWGVWLTLDRDDLDAAHGWFDRRGWAAVLLGRLAPGVRTLISVPAGLAAMPMSLFLALTTVGSAAWTALLLAGGYALASEYQRIGDWIDPVATAIFAAIALYYLYRVVTRLRAR